MKSISIVTLLAVFAVLTLTATAAAQQDPCGGATFTLAPDSGTAGTSVTATGTGSMNNNPFSIHWETAGGTTLASGTADGSGNMSAMITIPADATVGAHSVYLNGDLPNESPFSCPATFTVVAAAAETGAGPAAYAAVTTLPSTGLMAALLVTGLASAGAGALLLRKRS